MILEWHAICNWNVSVQVVSEEAISVRNEVFPKARVISLALIDKVRTWCLLPSSCVNSPSNYVSSMCLAVSNALVMGNVMLLSVGGYLYCGVQPWAINGVKVL